MKEENWQAIDHDAGVAELRGDRVATHGVDAPGGDLLGVDECRRRDLPFDTQVKLHPSGEIVGMGKVRPEVEEVALRPFPPGVEILIRATSAIQKTREVLNSVKLCSRLSE